MTVKGTQVTAGVLLDETYTESLIGRARREGLIPAGKYTPPYAPRREQRILDMLLLYDKLYLDASQAEIESKFGADISRLIEEGIVELLPRGSVTEIRTVDKQRDEIWMRYLSAILVGGEDGPAFDPDPDFFKLFSKVDVSTISFLSGMWNRSVRRGNQRYWRFPMSRGWFDVAVGAITDPQYRRTEEGKLTKRWTGQGRSSKYWAGHWQLHIFCAQLYQDNLEYQRLLDRSGQFGIPVITAKTRDISVKRRAPWREQSPSDDAYWRAYCVCVDEANTVPTPRDFTQAISLRKDRRIVDFRRTLQHWAQILRQEDPNAEMRIRGELKKANRALSQLNCAQRAGRYLTYLSLPVTLATLLTGMPFGLVLLPVGLALRVYSDVGFLKNRWLLLGK